MSTTFPLPGWTRDWTRPFYHGGSAYFVPEDRGHYTPCWIWQGSTCGGGYGRVSLDGHPRQAHRVIYEQSVGAIPDGLHLDHLCRQRDCVNPAHLEPVTVRVNLLRGVGFSARNAAKTHCVAGHEFTPENTYVRENGRRDCKTCKSRRMKEFYARRATTQGVPS